MFLSLRREAQEARGNFQEQHTNVTQLEQADGLQLYSSEPSLGQGQTGHMLTSKSLVT